MPVYLHKFPDLPPIMSSWQHPCLTWRISVIWLNQKPNSVLDCMYKYTSVCLGKSVHWKSKVFECHRSSPSHDQWWCGLNDTNRMEHLGRFCLASIYKFHEVECSIIQPDIRSGSVCDSINDKGASVCAIYLVQNPPDRGYRSLVKVTGWL